MSTEYEIASNIAAMRTTTSRKREMGFLVWFESDLNRCATLVYILW